MITKIMLSLMLLIYSLSFFYGGIWYHKDHPLWTRVLECVLGVLFVVLIAMTLFW